LYIWKNLKKLAKENKIIAYGFTFALLALFINATYIDVFEASKVAYTFWTIAGLFVGYSSSRHPERSEGSSDRRERKK
jgi:hypothetical protein